ncbi:hypothetical protein J2741_001905 [Methanolinea mesophila]|uniref:hypothetical protein n=1 Tax=Methanolinea mesophila TaxID=547055 RepID=UPI001AE7983A|nr:hypothetical protein [Methanolinea mesophila]MBP1929358.1 hypothetical protein [Methanolinea mesophila]
MTEPKSANPCCPLFGVKSGVPPIGIGILLILFAVIPVAIGMPGLPFPVTIVFVAAGIFFIWMGFAR